MHALTPSSALGLAAALTALAPSGLARADDEWRVTASMSIARDDHTATVLEDGRVVVASQGTSELYDPQAGAFKPSGSMAMVRSGHAAVRLKDGRVLVTGGQIDAVPWQTETAEIFDPKTETWSPTGSMATGRYVPALVLLADGRALVMGGWKGGSTAALSTAEIYDPATGAWSPTGSMTAPRQDFAAGLLPSGEVLAVGGASDYQVHLASAERFDPAAGTWSPAGTMAFTRVGHTLSILPSGEAVVIGGGTEGGYLSSAEIYDPKTSTFTKSGNMTTRRSGHVAGVLPSGEVLVAGGGTGVTSVGFSEFLADAELFDPTKGAFRAAGSMFSPRFGHTASVLKDGAVLVTGGMAIDLERYSTAELYAPIPVEPPDNASDPASGCACEASGRAERSSGAAWTALLLGAVVLGRRRR